MNQRRMFSLIKADTDTKARRGRLSTARGDVETPVFMPVGTQASVKALDLRELLEIGSRIILGNTYHLNIRPGMEIIREAGGLHQFMNWEGPILTDSGGFQVFSLARIRKIKPEGIHFRSHLDGSALFLGPVEAMAIQKDLGSDIAMVLDVCPPHGCTREESAEAVRKSINWAEVCRNQPRAEHQHVFGIVQGSSHEDLRRKCAERLVVLEFDGYAVGGVSVGEPEHEMFKAVDFAVPHLPADKPRYVMGLGTPSQLVELVARGVDMFDCVLPTRVARNGTAFTMTGTLNLKGSSYKKDWGPIEEGCDCFACRHYTRGYLRHLLNVGEILGLRMLSVHNSHLFMNLMKTIRDHIEQGSFGEFHREFTARYRPSKRILEQRAALWDGSKMS